MKESEPKWADVIIIGFIMFCCGLVIGMSL